MWTLARLLPVLVTASVLHGAVIYTLEFSFPLAGEHTISWTVPDLGSGPGAGSAVTTSEGQPVSGVIPITQQPTELWILFNIVTPADHRLQSTGPTLETPGFIFPVSLGETGTFLSTAGGSIHCGPPAPMDFCPPGSEAATFGILTIQSSASVPEPDTGLMVVLPFSIVFGVWTLRKVSGKCLYR